MRNKGFTLIELLAVIVILAIIALIAVPTILNIINDARTESKKRSIDLYGRSIELAIARKSLTEEVPMGGYKTSGNTLTLNDSDFSLDIEYDGERVECDFVQLHEDMTIALDDCKVDGEKINYFYGDNYIDIEYLESTGTQWIDTKYIPNGNTKVIVEFQMIEQTNVQQGIFGARSGNRNDFTLFTGCGYDKLQADYDGIGNLAHWGASIENLNLNEKNVIEMSNSLIVNNTLIKEMDLISFNGNLSMYIFANNDGGKIQLPATMKLYYIKVYDNEDNKIVFDFIPALDKDGIACLYDKVEKKFYYNQGTGEFEYGL